MEQTRKEIATHWRQRLSTWQTPREFWDAAEVFAEKVGEEAITAPEFNFFRDVWVGARLATGAGAQLVRLGANPPDIELRGDDGQDEIEIREVLRPGRRRGAEYREDRQQQRSARQYPEQDWPGVEVVLQALKDGIAHKSTDRAYSSKTILGIYLNVGDWDTERAAIEAALPEICAAALPPFRELWMLWHGRFYRQKSSGEMKVAELARHE